MDTESKRIRGKGVCSIDMVMRNNPPDTNVRGLFLLFFRHQQKAVDGSVDGAGII